MIKKIFLAFALLITSSNSFGLTISQQQTNTTLEGGVWFIINGSTPYEYVLSIPLSNLTVGEILEANSSCVVSLRTDQNNNYPGFNGAAFTASVLFLSQTQPGPGNWLTNWAGTQIGPQLGADIWSSGLGGQYNPYYVHNQNTSYTITSSDIGNRWLTLVMWVSSTSATSSDWILIEPNQCKMSVIRISN